MKKENVEVIAIPLCNIGFLLAYIIRLVAKAV